MLFDLWVLCLIATAGVMFLLSVIGDALNHVRQHLQERHTDIDTSAAPLNWGH